VTTDEFHQTDPGSLDQPPAVMIAVMRERLATMGREIRELKETQRKDMDDMRQSQKDLANKLDAVLTAMSEARGGWRTLMMIGGASGTIGAAVSWVVQHLGKGP